MHALAALSLASVFHWVLLAALILLLGFVAGGIFFLPSLIAVNGKISGSGFVVFLNILLGWTVIGWVLLLFYALSAPTIDDPEHPDNQTDAMLDRIVWKLRKMHADDPLFEEKLKAARSGRVH